MSWNENNNGYDTYGDENRAPRQFTPREGDWDCPGCGKSNFAKRTECFKCQERRPEGMGKPAGPPPGADRPDRNYNWASNRARYEYNSSSLDEKGMAPRDAELEKDLFETGMDNQTTLDFSRYENIPIRIERGDAPNPIKTFEEADLHPVVKENIRLAKYSKPTPVQQYSIPIVTEGKDLMACAQTGSGKTAAFLIPALSALFDKPELAKPRCQPYEYRSYCAEPLVLILAPTRELCSQIFDECRRWTYRGHLRPCAVYGGANSVSQIRQLERGCDILAAAPGRLMDFIERRKVSLNRVRYLILDEADRMLDMGFEGIIRNIVEKRGLNADRQTLMFSATFPRAIRKLARDFLRPDYLFLKVGRVGGTTNSITQKVMYVPEEEKREALRNLLNSQPPSRTLIFVETKRSADSLDQYLYERSFPSTSIHGDRTQMEREDALLAFKYGKCPILVATAVAARGIDIRNVMHVINYDMPNDMDEYIHRIGRTARVGKSGLATSFYNERSEMLAPELTKLLKENGQDIPDFLEQFITDNVVWEEDLDEENVPVPSYAGQKWAPQEKHIPGGPGSFANNATNDKPTGAADATWDSSNTAPSWDSGNAGGDISGGWDKPATVDKNTDAGWGNGPAPTASSGGWDSYDDNSAPATGGWGSNEDSAPAASSDGWGYNENSASNNSAGWGGAGETTTNDSYSHGYSNQRSNYNRSNDNGERRERRERREPSRRRDGDWDCSCGALNYSRRTECYKCQSPKNDGVNGDNSNNNSSNWGSSKDASWQSESIPADSNTDGGWGNNNSTHAADNSADGGWGASSESAPAADTSDWASSETTAPAATSGGWEESTPATANDDSGWGTPSNTASGW